MTRGADKVVVNQSTCAIHYIHAAIVEEEGRREASRLCGLCLASAMDGTPVCTSSRGQPWLPRLMMPVDRLAAHPSPLKTLMPVLFFFCEPTPRQDATLLQVDTPLGRIRS